ncbi:MAG: hypothetical protein QG671_3169, partial [Actinomycetota bacterium]|nr:hypothetical protein [Actinomycetota bacterium]
MTEQFPTEVGTEFKVRYLDLP